MVLPEELRARRGIRGPYILCVGHLLGFRNQLQLIQAFSVVRRVHGITDRQLVLAGRDQLPGYLAKITTAIDSLNLQGWVNLIGEVPHQEIRELISGCDVFAFPSTCENCPTSLLEALSIGVPVASSNFGPMPEVAGDAVVYFDPFNVEEIAGTLARLLRDESLRRTLSRDAVARAQHFPDAHQVALQTIAVITSAARQRSREPR